ncbi:MAG: LptF/LptG family permease, partial [Burkholderiales bacterium]
TEARKMTLSRKALPTEVLALVESPPERVELFWLMSIPDIAVLLTLVAVPLAQVNPRMGRSFNLLAAAFVYLVYTNCLHIVQSVIAQGKIDFWTGLVLPHAVAAVVVVGLFASRLSISGLFRRRRQSAIS